jgi:hypothetical protein
MDRNTDKVAGEFSKTLVLGSVTQRPPGLKSNMRGTVVGIKKCNNPHSTAVRQGLT